MKAAAKPPNDMWQPSVSQREAVMGNENYAERRAHQEMHRPALLTWTHQYSRPSYRKPCAGLQSVPITYPRRGSLCDTLSSVQSIHCSQPGTVSSALLSSAHPHCGHPLGPNFTLPKLPAEACLLLPASVPSFCLLTLPLSAHLHGSYPWPVWASRFFLALGNFSGYDLWPSWHCSTAGSKTLKKYNISLGQLQPSFWYPTVPREDTKQLLF